MGAITVLFAGQQPHLELIERLNMSDHAIEIIEVLTGTHMHAYCSGDVLML